jgi:hypothetical protein
VCSKARISGLTHDPHGTIPLKTAPNRPKRRSSEPFLTSCRIDEIASTHTRPASSPRLGRPPNQGSPAVRKRPCVKPLQVPLECVMKNNNQKHVCCTRHRPPTSHRPPTIATRITSLRETSECCKLSVMKNNDKKHVCCTGHRPPIIVIRLWPESNVISDVGKDCIHSG